MPIRKIPELINVNSIQDTDLLVIETSEGTKSIMVQNFTPSALETKSDASIKFNESKSYVDQEITTVNTKIQNIEQGNTVIAYATSSEKATQDAAGNVITNTYETKSDASNKLTEAKEYTNTEIAATIESIEKGEIAVSATKAPQDGEGNNIVNTYETKVDANAKLVEAKEYTDTEINTVKGLIQDIEEGQTTVAKASFASSASSATKATKDGSNNIIVDTYETKTDASAKLTEAKEYAQGLADALISGEDENNNPYKVAFATQATYAQKDYSGNVITDTYATIASVDKKPGMKTQGISIIVNGASPSACKNGEVFNAYSDENIILDAFLHPTAGNVAYGDYSHARGNLTVAWGNASSAEGYKTVARGDVSHAEGYNTIARDYQHASGKYNAEWDAPATAETQDASGNDALFMIGYGVSGATANAFRIASNGQCFISQYVNASGSDFAELFEWADGNPNDEDRRGLFVALEGDKIKLANPGDDYIGIVSGSQAFVGNSASEEWQGKYLTDVFGTRLTKEVEIPEQKDKDTGEIIHPAYTTTQYIVNPDYNPDEPYIMRENRQEWDIVGLLGQVVMVDDGTCVAGGYVKPLINGIGTAASSGYRVMKRIDDTHIKVLVK